MNNSISCEHTEFQCALDLSLPFPLFKIQDYHGEVIFKSSQHVLRGKKRQDFGPSIIKLKAEHSALVQQCTLCSITQKGHVSPLTPGHTNSDKRARRGGWV